MRIYITGSVGSGKSTLAKRASERTGWPYVSLDEVVYDAGRAQFEEGMARADRIVVLDLPLFVRKKRILLRWIKQRLGLERCIYRPHVKMLRAMFRWLKRYETGSDGTRSRVARYPEKVLYLHNNSEINEWIWSLPEQK